MIQARGNVALKNNEKFTEKAEVAIEQARLAMAGGEKGT